MGLLSLASWIGTVNAPALAAASPLALLALSPRLPFVAVAAGAVPAPAFFVVGLARLVAADPWHYLIGRHGLADLSERIGRRSPSAHRFVDRVGGIVRSRGLLVVALRPNGHVLCAAGAAGLRPVPVAAADVVGTTCYLAVVWIAGRSAPAHLLAASVLATRVCVVMGAGAVVCAGAHRLLRARSTGRTASARRGHPSANGVLPRGGSAPGGVEVS